MAPPKATDINSQLTDSTLGELENTQPFAILHLNPSLPNPGPKVIAARRRLLLRLLITINQDDSRVSITA